MPERSCAASRTLQTAFLGYHTSLTALMKAVCSFRSNSGIMCWYRVLKLLGCLQQPLFMPIFVPEKHSLIPLLNEGTCLPLARLSIRALTPPRVLREKSTLLHWISVSVHVHIESLNILWSTTMTVLVCVILHNHDPWRWNRILVAYFCVVYAAL